MDEENQQPAPPPVEMQEVLSSHILKIGYDAQAQQLHVHFAPTVKNPAGNKGFYPGIDADTAAQIMGAESIGSALHALVRKRVPFEQTNKPQF